MEKKLEVLTNSQPKLQEIRKALNGQFRERGPLIDGMLTALVAREMLFLLGPPGTAKSLVCEAVCKAISGNYFSWLISKFTVQEELFGPMSLKALENDKYERKTTNKLPEADVAFLDEIFKGSSAILNTLLTVTNERKFYNGDGAVKVPLQVLFGASNEIPEAQELAALYDRFALRFTVDSLQADTSVEALFTNPVDLSQIPGITIAELEAEQAKAAAVTVPADIVRILIELRRAVAKEGIYVSDRKWVQSLRIVKAFAHLNGHDVVTEDDLEILENVLWNLPEQHKIVKRLIQKLSNPLGDQIVKLTDAVQEIMDLRDKKAIQPTEAQKKVREALKKLKEIGKADQNAKLKAAIEKVQAANNTILKEDLGLE